MGAARSRRCPERRTALTDGEDNAPLARFRPAGAPLRSFGRRRGRKLSPRQQSLLTHGQERLAVPMDKPISEGGLRAMFSAPVQEVWLEIGFGAGEHLVWQAEQNPQAGFIGAEPYVNGVVAAMAAIEERCLQDRVRIHADDVHHLLNLLPPASLSRSFILFPDPWPKKRHLERRLVSRSLLDELDRLLRPGSELRFASDIASYTEATLELLKAHKAFELNHTFTSPDRHGAPRGRYKADNLRRRRYGTSRLPIIS